MAIRRRLLRNRADSVPLEVSYYPGVTSSLVFRLLDLHVSSSVRFLLLPGYVVGLAARVAIARSRSGGNERCRGPAGHDRLGPAPYLGGGAG